MPCPQCSCTFGPDELNIVVGGVFGNRDANNSQNCVCGHPAHFHTSGHPAEEPKLSATFSALFSWCSAPSSAYSGRYPAGSSNPMDLSKDCRCSAQSCPSSTCSSVSCGGNCSQPKSISPRQQFDNTQSRLDKDSKQSMSLSVQSAVSGAPDGELDQLEEPEPAAIMLRTAPFDPPGSAIRRRLITSPSSSSSF